MRREGRQHGMVKTFAVPTSPWTVRPRPRGPNGPSPTPTAGLFTKVPTKPTNHSKFTGKCGRLTCRDCHLSPPSKSKDKVKGAQRLKSSSHVVSDYRLITWRVVDAKPGLRLSGFSATDVLDYLDSGDDCMDHYYGDEHDDEEHNVTQVEESNYEIEEVVECEGIKNGINGDDDEDMSFSDVEFAEFAWQLEDGDEDWYLVSRKLDLLL